MPNKKTKKLLIVSGIALFILAPFAGYFLANEVLRLYCNASPSILCGLAFSPWLHFGITLCIFMVGMILMYFATRLDKKELKNRSVK
jgi:uncharacterized protein YneF (UPF0154 family)